LIQESDPNDCCWGYTTTLRREPIHCWLRPAGMRPVCCEPATDESGNDDWLNVIHSEQLEQLKVLELGPDLPELIG
jgi:hypothetical protein